MKLGISEVKKAIHSVNSNKTKKHDSELVTGRLQPSNMLLSNQDWQGAILITSSDQTCNRKQFRKIFEMLEKKYQSKYQSFHDKSLPAAIMPWFLNSY